MAWETDKHGKARYVQKIRIGGKVTSKVLGTGEAGKAAERAILELRQKQTQDKRRFKIADEYEHLAKLCVQHFFITRGYIRRKSVWQKISRLNKPLTPEEKTHIAFIKSLDPTNSSKLKSNRFPKNYPFILEGSVSLRTGGVLPSPRNSVEQLFPLFTEGGSAGKSATKALFRWMVSLRTGGVLPTSKSSKNPSRPRPEKNHATK